MSLRIIPPFLRNKLASNRFPSRQASQALPQLSSEKYGVKRKDYGQVGEADVDWFKSLLGKERVLTDESDIVPYNIDWIKNCRGQSQVVVKPRSSEEVSKILSYCNGKRLAICPQGGNTGLVGGSVPVFDEVVLSLELLNKIVNIDKLSGAVTCEAGVILSNLESAAHEAGLIVPLDLGAKGSCQIGGNVSTNAGGLRLLRYGNLHGSLLSLDAVLADGRILSCGRGLRKDNTGYALQHLFVGSEGTLGVVTKVAIHCPPAPKAYTLGFFGVDSFESAVNVLLSARDSLGEILSACEVIDQEAMRMTTECFNLTNPIEEHPFYVLIETSGSDETHDNEKMSRFLQQYSDSGLLSDGTVTSEPSKMQAIWRIRESIPGAGLQDGYVFKYDLSLPLKNYYDLVPALRERLGKRARSVYGYGHIGDGNIHMNVVVDKYSTETAGLIEPWVFQQVAKLRGSVSAEHGVGFRKTQYLHYSKDTAAIQLMRQLKDLMDPNHILNPYKVLIEPDSK